MLRKPQKKQHLDTFDAPLYTTSNKRLRKHLCSNQSFSFLAYRHTNFKNPFCHSRDLTASKKHQLKF